MTLRVEIKKLNIRIDCIRNDLRNSEYNSLTYKRLKKQLRELSLIRNDKKAFYDK